MYAQYLMGKLWRDGCGRKPEGSGNGARRQLGRNEFIEKAVNFYGYLE